MKAENGMSTEVIRVSKRGNYRAAVKNGWIRNKNQINK